MTGLRGRFASLTIGIDGQTIPITGGAALEVHPTDDEAAPVAWSDGLVELTPEEWDELLGLIPSPNPPRLLSAMLMVGELVAMRYGRPMATGSPEWFEALEALQYLDRRTLAALEAKGER